MYQSNKVGISLFILLTLVVACNDDLTVDAIDPVEPGMLDGMGVDEDNWKNLEVVVIEERKFRIIIDYNKSVSEMVEGWYGSKELYRISSEFEKLGLSRFPGSGSHSVDVWVCKLKKKQTGAEAILYGRMMTPEQVFQGLASRGREPARGEALVALVGEKEFFDFGNEFDDPIENPLVVVALGSIYPDKNGVEQVLALVLPGLVQELTATSYERSWSEDFYYLAQEKVSK